MRIWRLGQRTVLENRLMGKHILIYEVAVREIIELILREKLQPGDQLPAERELANQLKISRACIREALQVLSSNYVVQIKRGSGIYVNVLDEMVISKYAGKEATSEETLKAVKNIIEMRMILETHGFQQAAKAITPEQLHRLYSHEAVEYNTYLNYENNKPTGASMDFEQLILTFQPNSVLAGVHARLNETWKMYMSKLDAVALPPDKRHRDHLAIIIAVENNAPKQIAKAVSAHLDATCDAVERMLKSH